MKVSIIGAGNMARGIGTRVLAGGNDARAGRPRPGGGAGARRRAGRRHRERQRQRRRRGARHPVRRCGRRRRGARRRAARQGRRRHHEPRRLVDVRRARHAGRQLGGRGDREAPARGDACREGVQHDVRRRRSRPVRSPDRPLDVLLAGDDADAKEKVASFVEAGGLRPRRRRSASARPPARAARVPPHGRAGAAGLPASAARSSSTGRGLPRRSSCSTPAPTSAKARSGIRAEGR